MVRYAGEDDFALLRSREHCISDSELKNSIGAKRILVMFQGNLFAGWLRYNLFWDNTPFMNMLYFLEEYRGKGYGKQLVLFWEEEMRRRGYGWVLTSTLANEQAQFFYRKLGYADCGCLLLPDEALEILFRKSLSAS